MIANNENYQYCSAFMPLKKLFFRLLLSLGLYDLFWYYYKWKYLRDIEGKNFKPLLLTLTMGLPFLNVILPYILFKELLYSCTNLNKWAINIIALFSSFTMAFCLILIDLKGFYKLLTLLYFVPMFIMQLIINMGSVNNTDNTAMETIK